MRESASRSEIRLAELVATLSLGTDLGMGQPMEHVMRECLIALRLSERLGLDESRRGVVLTMMREILGGNPDATHADPEAVVRSFESSELMRAMFDLMKADHEGAQGPGYFKTYTAQQFDLA